MRFGSVCSGIEAASVAWGPLGWRAAWLAEIEPFPCAVLAHHYPDVPNLGDMTAIARRVLTGEVEAPDILCGGTPCQAFSVAGLRNSLDDARGNLTLKFVELANAIDHVRAARGEPPAIVFWENVPGVLSTKDNAFGCFLAGLAGEDGELEPPGGKWANAGAVYGPRRAVAWRTLDAQYFGVAQRRRRVFVVASARNGFDSAQVLFEWGGLRRDTAPRREAGQGPAPCVTAGAANGGAAHGARSGSAKDNLIIPAVVGTLTSGCGPNGNRTSGPIDQAAALNANLGCHNPGDFEAGTLLIQQTAHTLRGEGFDASEDGTGRGTPLVPVAAFTDTYNGMVTGDVAATLSTNSGDGVSAGPSVMVPVAFDTTKITSQTNRSNPQPGDPCHPLAAGAHAPAIAFNWQAGGTQTSLGYDQKYETAATLVKDQTQAVAVALRGREGGGTAELGDEVQNCLRASSGGGDKPHVLTAMQVRRLTPTECERLQGFPDGYTAIPWRKKPADECPDGPRYKALGNSWAVPNVRWLGQRIQQALQRLEHANDNGAGAAKAA